MIYLVVKRKGWHVVVNTLGLEIQDVVHFEYKGDNEFVIRVEKLEPLGSFVTVGTDSEVTFTYLGYSDCI